MTNTLASHRPKGRRALMAGIVLAALTTGLWYVDTTVRQARQEVMAAQNEQERLAAELLQLTMLRSELQKRSFDIGRIQLWVPAAGGVAKVVNDVEEEGRRLGLEPHISDLAEEPVFNDQGVQVEPSGPLREIRMTVSAAGESSRLLLFLRQLEYMPYVMRLATWDVVSGRALAPAGARSVPAVTEEDKTSVAEGSLRAEIIVSVSNQ